MAVVAALMDPLLVLSPHLDDAVLSMGQVLAGRPDAVVATIFTGCPPDAGRVSTSYDRNCGFRSAREAIVGRRAEDRAAMDLVGARSVHLGHLDHQYRGDVNPDEDDAFEQIVGLVDDYRVTQIVGPLGIGHCDHVIVARVMVRVLAERPALEPWIYEDLPSRVLWPEEVAPALGVWRGWGWVPTISFLGTGPLPVKEAALACYASQMWALDEHVIRCPERLHRLTRAT